MRCISFIKETYFCIQKKMPNSVVQIESIIVKCNIKNAMVKTR